MRWLVAAVSARLPVWAEDACAEYVKRMPRGWEVQRLAVKPEPRDTGKPLERLLAAEAQRLVALLPEGTRRIALDERGRDLTTAQFAQLLAGWREEGATTAFLIGGADGLERELLGGCASRLRLSSFTLPHALAQVLLCEQLYRAASLLAGHPYHRS